MCLNELYLFGIVFCVSNALLRNAFSQYLQINEWKINLKNKTFPFVLDIISFSVWPDIEIALLAIIPLFSFVWLFKTEPFAFSLFVFFSNLLTGWNTTGFLWRSWPRIDLTISQFCPIHSLKIGCNARSLISIASFYSDYTNANQLQIWNSIPMNFQY